MSVQAELLVVPDAQTLKDRLKALWAFQAARHVPRALRLLEREYEGMDLALPAADTVRHWIQREGWHAWADAEWARGYGQRAHRLKESMFTVLELLHERHLDALTGGPPLTKEEVALTQNYDKMFGIGAYGFNQGGELSLQFAVDDVEEQALSLEQRARKMRALQMERNKSA